MNAEDLLKHYARITEAPDAIPKLRRFVLDLAVRGKLVEQDAADEPASELLKRIAAEKARLVKAGEIRKPKLFAPIDEPPFYLPATWRWCRMREVTTDRGQMIPDQRFTYIDVSAINKEAGLIEAPTVLEPAEAPSRARKITRKGDVIYSCVRPYLLNVAVVEDDIKPSPIASTAFAILNGMGLVVPRYIWVVLRSPFIVSCVEDTQRGQAYPAINDADFAVLPFPLPPLAEQHRIVAKVDELMALCDRLEEACAAREGVRDNLTAASLARLTAPETTEQDFQSHARFALQSLPALTTHPAQIKPLRQTILNLAVRGKLVEQDAADEPAVELLRRIAQEKGRLLKSGEIKKQKPLSPIDEDETSFDLPKGWAWARLGDLSQVVTSGSRDWAKHYANEGAIFVRMGNLSKNHYQLRLDHIQRVSPPAGGEGTRTSLRGGDILISITGDVGMLGLIPNDFGEAYINQHTAMVRPMPDMKGRYLPELFRAPFAQDQFNAPQRGIKNSFRLTDVTQFVVPLPPLAEQHRIVAKVDALMALCDRLEASLTTADTTRQSLLTALLHEALDPAAALESA